MKSAFRPGMVLLLVLTMLAACTKTEEKVITGNKPPPDHTLPTGLKANFITKSYISLIGREPSTAEMDAAMGTLNSGDFSESARESVVSTILENDAYYTREFELTNNEVLNGLDTFQVVDIINTFEFLLTQPQYEPVYEQLQAELTRLYAFRTVPQQFAAGTLSIAGMQKACVNNYFYDQINMGSLNFVVSVYQHFLLRNPTEFEQAEGIKMVDGFNAIQFLQVGQSKDDFLNILFNSRDYREGQIKILFNRFFFRSPSSEEMTFYTSLLEQSNDPKVLIRTMLKSDEYAGLE